MIKPSKESWDKMPKWRRRLFAGLFIAAGVVALGLALGYLIVWLWNSLMPGIFGLPEITYWQAVGIFILAKIIFGSSIGGDNKEKSAKSKKKQTDGDSSDSKENENWEHYNEWWENEGKKAFDDYVNKQDGKNKSAPKAHEE